MAEQTHHGPIGAALRVLAPDAPAVRPRAPACLADLLDLRGSVTLADALSDLNGPSDARHDPSAAGRVRAEVEGRLGAVDSKLNGAFSELVEGRTSLLSFARISAALVDGGVLVGGVVADRGARATDLAARLVFSPVGDFIALRVERARSAVHELRLEVGPALGGLSPAATRLEKLDAVLAEVTQDAGERLYARLFPAIERAFAKELAAVLAALPAGSALTDAETRAWLAPGACVRAALEAATAAGLALFQHDRMALEALVDAAAKSIGG